MIGIYDVNGNGLNDVVTSLEAHTFGLAWFEQNRDAAGKISFVEHLIMGDHTTKNAGGVTFSQPHGGRLSPMWTETAFPPTAGKSAWVAPGR